MTAYIDTSRPDEHGTVHHPTCTDHEREWHGCPSRDAATARQNLTIHLADQHPVVEAAQDSLF